MNIFTVIILICYGVTPIPECNQSNARTSMYGPEAKNEMACAIQSQQYLGQTSLTVGKKEYVKIICRRTSIGKGNVG